MKDEDVADVFQILFGLMAAGVVMLSMLALNKFVFERFF